MIFSELYSAYYNTVAKLVDLSINGELNEEQMYKVIEKNAFSESVMSIVSAIKNEEWQVIKHDFTTPLKASPKMPLTTLQKRWLKAVERDPKMKLFGVEFNVGEVEPLFKHEDIVVFDKYMDGDNYEDEGYIQRFKLILNSIEEKFPLEVLMKNKKGEFIKRYVQPQKLEYSPKDDKFRLIGRGIRGKEIINLQKIAECKKRDTKIYFERQTKESEERFVTMEVVNERNAAERILLHFAHLKKEAVRTGRNAYKITLWYDAFDETELVIRILSFGPFIKVTEPENFVNLIKERLIKQKSRGI